VLVEMSMDKCGQPHWEYSCLVSIRSYSSRKARSSVCDTVTRSAFELVLGLFGQLFLQALQLLLAQGINAIAIVAGDTRRSITIVASGSECCTAVM
jgi:hypothetical protein